MKSTKQNSRYILDSDDELPDSYYEETSVIPAYLNDARFDHIELPWLDNCKPVQITKKHQKPAVKIEEPIKIEKGKSKILISKGVLTTRDLFYVRSIEDYCSEATLIWFIESLKNKSIPDRFRRSCLASDFLDADLKNNGIDSYNSFNANYYFSLVVSM